MRWSYSYVYIMAMDLCISRASFRQTRLILVRQVAPSINQPTNFKWWLNLHYLFIVCFKTRFKIVYFSLKWERYPSVVISHTHTHIHKILVSHPIHLISSHHYVFMDSFSFNFFETMLPLHPTDIATKLKKLYYLISFHFQWCGSFSSFERKAW